MPVPHVHAHTHKLTQISRTSTRSCYNTIQNVLFVLSVFWQNVHLIYINQHTHTTVPCHCSHQADQILMMIRSLFITGRCWRFFKNIIYKILLKNVINSKFTVKCFVFSFYIVVIEPVVFGSYCQDLTNYYLLILWEIRLLFLSKSVFKQRQ